MTQITKEQGERAAEIVGAAGRVIGILLVLFCPSVWGRLGGLVLLAAEFTWIDDGQWIGKKTDGGP